MRAIEVIFNKPFSESLVEQNRFRCEITQLYELFPQGSTIHIICVFPKIYTEDHLCPKMSLFIRVSEKTQRGGK